jgi:ABC-2 type transport system ATP-binding protein
VDPETIARSVAVSGGQLQNGFMTNTDAAITVHDLHMTYPRGTKAVRGVSFDVRRGEVFALLGPNGAGKTTTVEILEGFRTRTSGDVNVLGMDPANANRSWRDRVGIVFQGTSTSDDATVREILTLQSKYHSTVRPVDEVIALVGLDEKRDTRADRLSGGQQRRLDVARGIIGRPELLFLDEPTTGFDPEARRQFWDLIRALQNDGTTIILTTHYLDEASILADRVGVIIAGQLVALDVPESIGGNRSVATVQWRENNELRTEETQQPAEVVMSLVSRLGSNIDDLTISRPSLEDAYLQLVGRHTAESETESTEARNATDRSAS